MNTIVVKARYARTFWEKTRGLLGTHPGEPLFFHTRFGIHTFGMQYPIDIFILDTHNRIITIKQSLGKNRLFFWNPLYERVLEIPHRDSGGAFAVGDTILVEPIN